jgi:hypothetical protein
MQASLKSADTEEWIDLVFYRPLGYQWALFFNKLGVTPNAITIASIFLGVAAGVMFYFDNLWLNVIGMLLLVWANQYDSADGQLARLTGQKSELGRILDGASGDCWFISIYLAIVLRLTPTWGIWGWLLGAYAGYWCHIRQANLADYYRNLHLFFQLGPARSELDRSHLLRQRYDSLRWHSSAWFEKLYLFFYIRYTLRQEHMTPRCQEMLNYLLSPTSAGSVSGVFATTPSAPAAPSPSPSLREAFLRRSRPMMPACQALTFDLRIAVLYLTALLDIVWVYFLFEAIVLQIIFFRLRSRHEQLCADITTQYLTPSTAPDAPPSDSIPSQS